MLFDLEVLSDGQAKTIRFDNEKNLFTDPLTGKVYLKESRTQDYKRQNTTFDVNFEQCGVVYINLGLNCNFSCKYCHQNAFRKETQVETCTPEKIPHFIDLLKKTKLNPKAICFWGGEPLVHWKSLKVLIPALRDLYPDIKINFPTNGALITDEILNFLKKYNVGYYISYDGKVTNRDSSIFDDKELVEALKRAKDGLHIMPTQNRKSVPIHVLKQEINDLGLKLKSLAIYSVARCNPWNKQFANEIKIPDEQIQQHGEFVYKALREEVPDSRLYAGLRERFDNVAFFYYRGIGIDGYAVHYCSNTAGLDICVDITGKIFSCMNIPLHVMGTLDNFKPFDASHIYQNHLFKSACRGCPFVTCCRGGCALIHDDQSIEFQVSCHNLKAIAVPMFRFAIECLLGVYLKKITRVSDGKVFGEF